MALGGSVPDEEMLELIDHRARLVTRQVAL
jgi:hypothetical protein